MEILELKVMRGPNYWSGYRKELIVMKLDLQELEELPTNRIDGFADRLEAMMPSLYSHRCSEKKPGGFFERVRQGTWMGHVIEHIALELQSLAGMPCGFGRTRSAQDKGVYWVVFSYVVESAGLFAAKAAVRMASRLANDEEYDISNDVKELIRINQEEGLGPSTLSIIEEAKQRNIPYKRLDKSSLVMLGQGVHQKIIRATMACSTSSIGVEIAADKKETMHILSQGFVPIPKGGTAITFEQVEKIISEIGFPIVIKPVNGNHGRGVTTNIESIDKAKGAFDKARQISAEVIVERFIKGSDYRFLVVDYKVVAVARRTPPMVVGNDQSTVRELISKVNADPKRGEGHEKILTTIKVDEATQSILVEKNLTLNSILPVGEVLFLKDTANLSSGGTARDVTQVVHPYNVFLAERIARLMDLDICGIDIIAEDIKSPINDKSGAVLEVNSGPGLRMHLAPSAGLARNVAEPIVKMLFPPGAPSRIPIVAVTGTNGKTTTVRLVAHIAKCAGHSTGFCTTDGIYIQDQLVHAGDCSGPSSAETVLRDPIVDFAVLECARGGILRAGLGFDQCDISIITNISEDHLGLDEIQSLEKLARVKGVVARSTSPTGTTILNAEDDLVYAMKDEVDSTVALFSFDNQNPRLVEHLRRGGLAATVEKGFFVVYKGKWKTRIAKVDEVPLTFEGRAECMIRNTLAAILAAVIRDIPATIITDAIKSFVPSPETTPGRMNIFEFPSFKVMVDYAHNPDGFLNLKKFLDQQEANVKVGIIAAPGDRRNEDIMNIGSHSAMMFDKIIIRHDDDGRGRSNDEITQLLIQGLHSVRENIPVRIISNEVEAIQYAIDTAEPGTFIVDCTDKVMDVLKFMKEAMTRYQEKEISRNTVSINKLGDVA
jgi:cyanophycin synthetase